MQGKLETLSGLSHNSLLDAEDTQIFMVESEMVEMTLNVEGIHQTYDMMQELTSKTLRLLSGSAKGN